jgi:hypothetical protein
LDNYFEDYIMNSNSSNNSVDWSGYMVLLEIQTPEVLKKELASFEELLGGVNGALATEVEGTPAYEIHKAAAANYAKIICRIKELLSPN